MFARSDGQRLWKVAVLSHLRNAFRSEDIWLTHSRRYGDLKQVLVPIEAAKATLRLMVLFDPVEWLDNRKAAWPRARSAWPLPPNLAPFRAAPLRMASLN